MKLLDALLVAVLLALAGFGLTLYLRLMKRREEVPVADLEAERREYDAFIGSYPPAAFAVASSYTEIRGLLEGNVIQSMDELYVKARFEPEALKQVRGIISQKEPKVAEVQALLARQTADLEALNSKASKLSKVQKVYAKKSVNYLSGANNMQTDVVASLRGFLDYVIKGLDDLEAKGPRQASIYLKSDDFDLKSGLRVKMVDGMDAADKFVTASRLEYDKLVKTPPGTAMVKD